MAPRSVRLNAGVKLSHLPSFISGGFFFVEGAPTILVAVIAVLVLPDFPQKSHWFLSEEIWLAELRMREDAGMSGSASARPKLAERC